MGGITTRVNVVTGSYTTRTGAVTLNTGTNPHGIHPGDTFTYVAASGAAAQVQGEYVALTVPDAFTVTAQAAAGLVGGDPPLTTGRVGTCIKSCNSGFVDCTLRNIRDIGLCFYGGVVGGYIRGCDVDAGPLIYSDAGQPGSNIDCELSGNYTHDASFGGPAVVSQQFGISQHNCRVYDNIVRNMARGGINLTACDGVEVYGNSLHNNAPVFSGASHQSGQINVGNGTVRANIWGNTIRDPGPAATAQQIIVVTAMTYVNVTGLTTLTLASAPTLPINVGDKFIVFNILGFVAPDGSSTSYLRLNGTWTAATGTTGSTVVYTAPAGLGTITLLGTSGGVIASTLAVTTHIAAGNYSSDASGNISLTTTPPHKLVAGDAFVLASVVGSPSGVLLAGLQIATAGTTDNTLNFVTVPSLASFAITSGNMWPANFGIAIDAPDYCRIAGNRIGDYQKPGVMTACIGGTWGLNGASEGNYFGPRNQPDPDVSLYGSGVNGFNYDLLFGTTLANNSIDGQVTFRGVTQASNPQSAYYPPQGLTPGWNRGPTPHGEVDFFLGEGLGSPGGFDFLQVAVIKIVASPVGPPIPYDPTTGIVTLTTAIAHGLVPGSSFTIAGLIGTDSVAGADVQRLAGSHVANSDTTGTTLTYTVALSLTVTSVNAGATVAPAVGGSGALKTTVGVGGSLLANDGYGNTRLGGALVHGMMQTVASLANAGTVTVNPHTSMVLIRNSASIATATVVVPAALAFQFAAGAELELNFQNPIGALTWSPVISGAPTTITQAGASVNFINSGTVWLRRIAI
jgi:parallel beta-helix repeat protein